MSCVEDFLFFKDTQAVNALPVHNAASCIHEFNVSGAPFSGGGLRSVTSSVLVQSLTGLELSPVVAQRLYFSKRALQEQW